MTFSNIDSLGQGSLLTIVFDHEVYKQLSEDIRDFELLEVKQLEGVSPAREFRYYLQTSRGPSAVGHVNPGTTARSFPTAAQSSGSELIGKLKETDATIELEHNLFERAMLSPSDSYESDPFDMELINKTMVMKRKAGVALHGDGSGVLGVISSVSNSGSNCTVTLNVANTGTANIGHAGNFEEDDKIIHKAAAGTAGSTVTLSAGTFSYWKVVSVDRDNQRVVLKAYDTNDASTATISSFSPAAGEALYYSNQATFVNTASISDYGTATEVMVGLDSWANDDGRTIFGVAHSGALNASIYDGAGAPLSAKMLQRALSRAKTRAGAIYRYRKGILSPESLDALIDANEADRRIIASADNARGFEGGFRFLHQNDQIEMVASEFCLPKRVWFLPEDKNGKKAVKFVGTSIRPISMGSQSMFLKPASGGGHQNMVVGYMRMVGGIFGSAPRAIGVVRNFTNA